MIDFTAARAKMVESQIRTEDVTDYDILAAMGAVPREIFVPEKQKALAYVDEDIAITGYRDGEAPRYLIEPAPFARLVQLAEIEPSDTVLDVGSGSGYSTAVLARLASSVVGLESDPELSAVAVRNLSSLGLTNARIVSGPLEAGHAASAPYDVIILEGAIEIVPNTLFEQLKEGGRLVAVIGYGRSAPATVYTKTDGDIGARPAFDARIPALPGFRKPKAFVF